MKWYNCWLAHSWGPWNEPQNGIAWSIWEGDQIQLLVQVRRCHVCNKMKIRSTS